MEKFSRNSRVVAITKILSENPNKVVSLNVFSELLNAAKSTVSEDIVIVREILEKLSLGKVQTVAGAAGGIKFIANISEDEKLSFAEDMCNLLMEKERIIPGNFVYMTDVMYSPEFIKKAGLMLSTFFTNKNIDYVMTVETKGIPLAYEVARNLGVELVIVRRDNKVTEGPTVTINYVTGSSGNIQNMCLSKKSIKRGCNCLYIDDFMRSGGTALGIKDLLKEFDSNLVGMGVLIDDYTVNEKLVDGYYSIMDFKGVIEGKAEFSISKCLKK
ncbi:pur operon repressor [Clostridium hydrogeniformans]|uniref:pur operon repressor n=1 Tax=Clostridium hydrogeniformans TaxID=349933 RepID=UPI00068E6353|nr:pur operon repressor [Clostridium hydrogeniformans]